MQKHNNLQWFVLAIYKVNFSMKKRLQKLLKNFENFSHFENLD